MVVREQDRLDGIGNDSVYAVSWECMTEVGWRTRTLEERLR